MEDKDIKRVALYLRYSSDKQQEQSIEGQDKVCTDYCLRRGWTIVARFADRAKSAFSHTDKREGFLEMIDRASKREFDAVVVYKVDRFSRDDYETAYYTRKLTMAGVALISAAENLNSLSDEKSQILTMGIMGAMAHYFSIELSEKVTRGMKVSASHCRFNGGVTPLGYKIEDKQFKINPETAPIVQEAFKRVAEGEDMISVIRDFNARGLKTARGLPFSKGSLQNLLRSTKYLGVYKYADITKEGGIPALVGESDFYKVQAKLKTKEHKAKKGGKAMIDYLLTGKLICGECGSPMVGYSSSGRGNKPYRYYICSAKHRHIGHCSKSPISKEAIENAVTEEALNLFNDDKLMEELYEGVAQELKRMFSNQTEALNNYQDELKDLEKRKANVMKALEINPNLAKDIEPKIDELNAQISGDKERIATISSEVKASEVDKDSVKYMVNTLIFGKGKDWEKEQIARNVITILVDRVVIYESNKIEIYFNINKNASSKKDGAYEQLMVTRIGFEPMYVSVKGI